MGKIKVAMICTYSDKMVRSHLRLNNLKLTNFLHHTILRRGTFGYRDDAPWNGMIIKNAISRQDWDLHIISSHFGMKEKMVEFEDSGVNYHYFKGSQVFPFNYLDKLLHPSDTKSFSRNRNSINGVIRKIKPDIVLLIGAENPLYSTAGLDVEGIPLYILCQMVVVGNGKDYSSAHGQMILNTERQLFNHTQYVGVYCAKHYYQLVGSGYKGNIFEFQWPPAKGKECPVKYEGPKEYDFINFAARATDDKGFRDSVLALAIVKKKYPNVSLNLKVDSGKERLQLQQLAGELGLTKNISYTDSFANSSDLMLHIQKSRYAVLPCKLDNTSGTMTQSMMYGLPIVVYKTLGTSAYNYEKECAKVAEMEDVNGLAAKMLELMDNPQRAEEIAANAKEFIANRDARRVNAMDRIVADVNAIIGNYKDQKPIPEELLFNPEIQY